MRRSILFAVSMLALAGCARAPDVNVRETWGRSLQPLGVQAIYPMRENVFPGDILLLVRDPCGHERMSRQPETALLGAIPPEAVRAMLRRFYDTRPEFAPTFDSNRNSLPGPNKPGEGGSLPGLSQPVQTAAGGVFAEAPRTGLSRGPLVAFPAITIGSFTRAQLGLTAAAGGGLGRFFGLGAEAEETIGVAVSQVEELHVPPLAMAELINLYLGRTASRTLLESPQLDTVIEMMRAQQREQVGCRAPRMLEPMVLFISRVFYARAIEFDFGNRSALALEAGAALQRQSAVGRRPTIPGAPTQDGTNRSNLEGDVNAELAALATLATNGTPGIGASLGIGSSGSVVLRQAFNRPLAFGVDQSFGYRLSDLRGGGAGQPNRHAAAPDPTGAVAPLLVQVQFSPGAPAGGVRPSPAPPGRLDDSIPGLGDPLPGPWPRPIPVPMPVPDVPLRPLSPLDRDSFRMENAPPARDRPAVSPR